LAAHRAPVRQLHRMRRVRCVPRTTRTGVFATAQAAGTRAQRKSSSSRSAKPYSSAASISVASWSPAQLLT
jgi:hypothetical protein